MPTPTYDTIDSRFSIRRAYMERCADRIEAGDFKMRNRWWAHLFAAEDRFRALYPDTPEDCYCAAHEEAFLLAAMAEEHGERVIANIFDPARMTSARPLPKHAASVLFAIRTQIGNKAVDAIFGAIRERTTAH